ncbi:peptide-methionine (S)-S-oxide reductase [Saccharibacillus sp. O23]|uniref:peptide-methionine (S)-S-oxide reductase n=1 Tax=Saccharibacillus sp. O23 TaxID=2009338 RepID=UPI0026A77797|nr:peptide-methionine (S)-S-oxide reductase [Saccharibacillus sp. O23]
MSREKLTFAMGCFWGPEDRFARIPGVTGTRVGYAGGDAAGRPEGGGSKADSAVQPASIEPQEAASSGEEAAAGFPGCDGTVREAALHGENSEPPKPSESASPDAAAPLSELPANASPGDRPEPAPTHRRLHGHSEVVEVEFDPEVVSLEELLRRFWSEHNPAAIEGYKPEDSRYRSLLLYRGEEQRAVMERVRREMAEQGKSGEATGLKPLGQFHPAEEKHQRYEEKKRLRNGGSESPKYGGG